MSDSGQRRVSTIVDVARLAGVSRGTVSNVFSGLETVKPRLRERVLLAARELSYVPNRNARNLRAVRTNAIGVMMPYLANLFFGHLVEAVESVLHPRGYLAVTGSAGSSPELRVQYLNALVSWRVDGLLVFPSQNLIDPLVRLSRAGTPVMLVERDFPGAEAEGLDAVVLDHAFGVHEATRHLLELGHRRVGLVNLPATSLSSAPRLEGYRAALSEGRLPYDESLVATGTGSFDTGYRLTAELLSLPDRPTALVVTANEMGFGCLEQLRALGLRVPEDVSVVVYAAPKDGVAATSSSVTTVTLQADELGQRAAELLIERVEGRRRHPVREVMKPHLEVRRSTAPRAPLSGSSN